MIDRETLDGLFQDRGYTDYKWIQAKDIEVAQWVRVKCMFGCPNYGRKGTCPPNVPSVEECRAFFAGYEDAVILHFQRTLDRTEKFHEWGKRTSEGLNKLEREVFLSGHRKAFMLYTDNCDFCKECSASRDKCQNPKIARPSVESMAVDVYATVRKHGFPIQVLKNYDETMNRYAFLMVD
jgi:predicted metal-binding protein